MFHFRSMNLRRDPVFIKKFGTNLRVIRTSKGMTQEKLADMAEIPRSQVSEIERGVGNPTISTVKLLADILGVEIHKLFIFE